MTVHIFHHSFMRSGGMERYALGLAATLKDSGHQVVFHARKTDPELAQAMGIEVRTVKVPRFPRRWREFAYFRHIARVAPGLEGLQIALSRVPARDLAICGGTHRAWLKQAGRTGGPFDWLEIRMETKAYRSARRIVSHSLLCLEEMVGLYGVPRDKLFPIFPPVDAVFAPPADLAQRVRQRDKLGWPDGKVVLLFPSMGHSRKGLEPLCRALEKFGEKIILAVAGRPSHVRLPFVRDLGYVREMPQAYQAADFTVLGSLYEPFGLVGPESIRCGTRLIFEEKIGCLPAIKPEFVFKFSVCDAASIQRAVAQAIELARTGGHHLERPEDALTYDPSPSAHTRALLKLGAP